MLRWCFCNLSTLADKVSINLHTSDIVDASVCDRAWTVSYSAIEYEDVLDDGVLNILPALSAIFASLSCFASLGVHSWKVA